MFSLRFHEQNVPCTTTNNINSRTISSRHLSNITNTSNPSLLLLFLASSFTVAAGTPLQLDQNGLLQKRDASTNSSGVSPKIMVLIIIAVLGSLILGGAVAAWRKRAPFNSLSIFSRTSVGAPMGGSAPATRELTAEQLAGTINGDVAAGNGNGAARTTRRARRPRRTPSQMSVTSLPAYNKEPGEEELVIFRGRDMEDATMPTATAMTSLDEENDGSSFSHDNSQPSRYSPMPTSPNNMPLLQDDNVYGDLSLQSIPDVLPPQQSRNSLSSHESSSLMRTDSNLPEESTEPRGEAPAYYEVVDLNDTQNNNPTSTNVRRQPSNASANPNRRSGFRTLLNRMSMASSPQNTQNHNRNTSVNSTFSSNISHTPEPTTSRISGHRPTHSASGSLLSVSMFRTLSRQKSNHTLNSNRLNSPSLISLNSISSPLTHTATRTEFTYPKSGPTAEQLKMISSRDSIVRFGVPYGADAIAYASSSRLDLIPPPDFDSTMEASRAGVVAVGAGPSRLRSTSNLERSSEATRPATRNSAVVVVDSLVPASDSSSSSPSPPQNTDENKPATSVSSTSPALAAAAVSTAENASVNENENASSGASHPTSSSVVPGSDLSPSQSPDAKETKPHSSTSAKSAHVRVQPEPEPSVSEFGKLTIPPSSYNDHTASSTRSESRASVFTFATAAESLSPSMRSSARDSATETEGEDEFFSEAESVSAPSTPRLGGQHGLELTDETIVQHDPKRDTIIASTSTSISS